MINYIHLILCLPFYILGFIFGYIARPLIIAFYWGYFYIELKANQEVLNQVNQQVEQLLKEKDIKYEPRDSMEQ